MIQGNTSVFLVDDEVTLPPKLIFLSWTSALSFLTGEDSLLSEETSSTLPTLQ